MLLGGGGGWQSSLELSLETDDKLVWCRLAFHEREGVVSLEHDDKVVLFGTGHHVTGP